MQLLILLLQVRHSLEHIAHVFTPLIFNNIVPFGQEDDEHVPFIRSTDVFPVQLRHEVSLEQLKQGDEQVLHTLLLVSANVPEGHEVESMQVSLNK